MRVYKSTTADRARSIAWGAAHRERTRAKSRAWYIDNRQLQLTREKAKYVLDPEPARARARAQQQADPTRSYARSRAWEAAHPARARANHRNRDVRRRARIARVLATLTAAEWEAILEAAGHACIYCGSKRQITQDHLTPISRGGDHTAENVAPACGPCNSSKGAKAVAEFLAEKEE